ncbi:VOC family protein [Sphingomonas arantia]|uniref:VOC family protein n=1 Tax=Sphingomonas arantia TaxID=1460676 RepID=A0ABW4TWI1_9SPHN
MARLNYVEMATADTARDRAFYAAAFGWAMTAYGPSYAATTTGDVDLGIDGDLPAGTAPLPVIEVDDLEAAQVMVEAAGGVVTVATFGFPGGRRFHFADPSGNVLAVMQAG